MVDKCHIRKQDIPLAVEFAKKLAKKYKLKDITNNRKKKFTDRIMIGVSEKYFGKGHLVLATNDPYITGDFMTEFANDLWVKYHIRSEWSW